ncbi:MAG: hypothetical protein WC980_05065 [Candidatus Brocadiia bacterium]
MADEVKLDILITVPTSVEPAGDMPERWAANLTGNATILYDRILEVLPDENEFNNRVAEPANDKWKPMVDPGFVSQAGHDKAEIQKAHYKGLAGAYNKFINKLGFAFATVDGIPAKRFKDGVNNAKDNWADGAARSSLRITGDRIRGLILPQVIYWLTGDRLANQMTKHMEVIQGEPYNFTLSGLRQQFRSAVSSLLMTAGITIIKADMESAVVATQNGRLKDLANLFKSAAVKPFVAGGVATDSLLQFEYSEGEDAKLKLHARIVLV